jgi:Holliday junction resolvase
MSNTGRRRGHDRERDLRTHLGQCGWVVLRAAGSMGELDLVAIAGPSCMYPWSMLTALPEGAPTNPKRGDILLVEVKSTSRAFERFGPGARAALQQLAEWTGGAAWLAWKPKGATGWTWIHSANWPATSTAAAGSPAGNGRLEPTQNSPTHRSG